MTNVCGCNAQQHITCVQHIRLVVWYTICLKEASLYEQHTSCWQQQRGFLDSMPISAISVILYSLFPEPREGREMAWFLMFANVLNSS